MLSRVTARDDWRLFHPVGVARSSPGRTCWLSIRRDVTDAQHKMAGVKRENFERTSV